MSLIPGFGPLQTTLKLDTVVYICNRQTDAMEKRQEALTQTRWKENQTSKASLTATRYGTCTCTHTCGVHTHTHKVCRRKDNSYRIIFMYVMNMCHSDNK